VHQRWALRAGVTVEEFDGHLKGIAAAAALHLTPAKASAVEAVARLMARPLSQYRLDRAVVDSRSSSPSPGAVDTRLPPAGEFRPSCGSATAEARLRGQLVCVGRSLAEVCSTGRRDCLAAEAVEAASRSAPGDGKPHRAGVQRFPIS
jgi:hypothetical protein